MPYNFQQKQLAPKCLVSAATSPGDVPRITAKTVECQCKDSRKARARTHLRSYHQKGSTSVRGKQTQKPSGKNMFFSMMQRVRTDIIKKKMALRDQSAIRVSVAFGQLLPQKYRKIALVTAAMQQVPEIKYQ